jgi:WD40 repeat protein
LQQQWRKIHTLRGARPDSQLKLWDATTGKELRSLADRPRDSFGYLAFSPDGKTLATTSAPRTRSSAYLSTPPGDDHTDITLWEVATGKEIVSRTLQGESGSLGMPSAPYSNESAQATMRFTPDGRRLAIASEVILPDKPYSQTALRFWDVEGLKEGGLIQSEEYGSLRDYALSPDGKTVAVAWMGARATSGPTQTVVYAPAPVTITDITTGMEVARISPPRSGFAAVAFSPDGTLLATQDNEGIVKLWGRTSTKLGSRADAVRQNTRQAPEVSATEFRTSSVANLDQKEVPEKAQPVA